MILVVHTKWTESNPPLMSTGSDYFEYPAGRQRSIIVVNVANWDTTPVSVKETRGLSQMGWSPVCNCIVFVLFEKN